VKIILGKVDAATALCDEGVMVGVFAARFVHLLSGAVCHPHCWDPRVI